MNASARRYPDIQSGKDTLGTEHLVRSVLELPVSWLPVATVAVIQLISATASEDSSLLCRDYLQVLHNLPK